MKRSWAAVVAAFALVGCGGGGGGSQPSTGSDLGTTTSGSEPAQVVRGSVGDTLRTADDYDQDGRPVHERLAITLLGVKTAVHPEAGLEPDKGNRYYAVRLKITQSGSTSTSPTPEQFSLLDSDGQSYDTAPYSGLAKPELGGQQDAIRLDPGDTVSGYIVFQVPTGVRPTTLKFHDSGFGPPPDTASWKLS